MRRLLPLFAARRVRAESAGRRGADAADRRRPRTSRSHRRRAKPPGRSVGGPQRPDRRADARSRRRRSSCRRSTRSRCRTACRSTPIKDNRLPTINVQLAITRRSRARAARAARRRRGHRRHARQGHARSRRGRAREGDRLRRRHDRCRGDVRGDAGVVRRARTRSRRRAWACMAEMLTQSTFPDDRALEDQGADGRHGARAARRRRPRSRASTCRILLWGPDHVRGWINSEQSVAALRREDVIAWAKTWYVPNNSMLVVAGDVDPKTIKGELERAFGGWKKAPVPPTPSYQGARPVRASGSGSSTSRARRRRTSASRSSAFVTDDPRFFDTLVWNYVLGGGAFSSRLMKVVRVEGNKAYGASSAFDRNLEKGSFVAQTFTRNSEAVATAKLIIAQLAKMQKDGPSDEEIAVGGREPRGRLRDAIPVCRRRRIGADGRRAARLRRRVLAELSAAGRQGRRDVGASRRSRDHRFAQLRHRDGRRRQGSRAAAQERRLALREGLVHRSDLAGASSCPMRRPMRKRSRRPRSC